MRNTLENDKRERIQLHENAMLVRQSKELQPTRIYPCQHRDRPGSLGPMLDVKGQIASRKKIMLEKGWIYPNSDKGLGWN